MRVIDIKWLIWLFLLLVGSCTQAEVENGDIPPYALKEVTVGFNLNVLASQRSVTRSVEFPLEDIVDTNLLIIDEKERIHTRAAQSLDEDQESKIAGIWVGQYDLLTGVLLFNKYFSSLTGSTVNIKLKQSQENAKSHVWFIANVGDVGDIGTETELKKHVLSYASTKSGLPESNLCGMTGMWEGIVQEGGMKNVTVGLTRLLAKISFSYSMIKDSLTFTPVSVTLKSVPQKSQVDAPESQLVDMTYTNYSGTADENGATMYWYLPENMAGTVKTGDTVDSEKKKTGKGVINATFIELTGTAVQGGVTYDDVTFRFYPGSGVNNYDIVRNSHYTMNVTLVGIDISDDRITVGRIPPIAMTEGNMPAEKDGTKDVQITARPGQAWSFDLEEWLLAEIEGKEAGTGVTVSYQGPAKVTFKAVSANPKAEERSVSFSVNVNGQDQDITITQDGSVLTKGNDISLDAASDSESSSTCKVTKGLQWQAAVSGEDWWSWADSNSTNSGDESDGNDLPLNIKSLSSNPFAQERTGKITVTAGASVGDQTYTGLKGEITVKQAGSTVKGSTVELEPVAATNQSSSFTATSGLAWIADVTKGDWLTLTGSTSGKPATGSTQEVSFNVTVNPTASQRNGTITVRAGDKAGGPTGVITVNQKASSLTASGDKTILAAIADDSGALTFKATSGLSYSVVKPDWLTLTGLISGITDGNNQTFGYKTSSVNLSSTDKSGNISMTVGEMKQNVVVKQCGSTFIVEPAILNLESKATSGMVTVTGTKGLTWMVNPTVTTNGITPAITSATADGSGQTLSFNATVNDGDTRTTTFRVFVANSDHLETIKVCQHRKNILVIDQSMADNYRKAQPDLSSYPPFSYDYGNVTGSGSDYKGISSNCTIAESYAIEVENTQSSSVYIYNDGSAKKYCTDKGSGWRLPTIIELYTMWYKCKGKNDDATDNEAESTTLGKKFVKDWYWSSSIFVNSDDRRCLLYFFNGNFNTASYTTYSRYIRCVRDI